MSDKKISALTDGTTPATTDLFPAARSGGTTVQMAWSELKAAMPGAEIGYDQITTATITITSTTESSATTIITCGAHTFDGGPVMVDFCAPVMGTPSSTSTNSVSFMLFESTTEIARLATVGGNETLGTFSTLFCVRGGFRFTPSAGSHTYIISAFSSATGAIVYSGSGGTATSAPTWVRFTKV